MPPPLVAIVVFGQESSQNLCRFLASISIKFKLVLPSQIPTFVPTHIILSGGPDHVYEPGALMMPKWVFQSSAPVLGICYGMELIAHTFNGIVIRMAHPEHGIVDVTEIVDGTQQTHQRWMNRNDQVLASPPGFTVTGVTTKGHIASITDKNRWWGVQYHPESFHDPNKDVFHRFLALALI